MAAINPTDVTALIVDEFIRNATTHLTTISGIVNTLSIFPPLPSAAPGIVNWTGYTVAPTTYTKAAIRDRIILNEILAKPDDGSIQLETDPEVNRQFNENKGANEGYKVDEDAGGFSDGVADLVTSKIVTTATLPASLVYNDLTNVSSTTAATTDATTAATTGTTLDGTEEISEDIGGTTAPLKPVFFVPKPPPRSIQNNGYPPGVYQQSTPYFPAGASVAEKAVAIALTDIKDGVIEIPDSSNTGHPRLLQIQRTAARSEWTEFPWCASAVFTWWYEAGFPFATDPNDPAYLVNPKHCVSWQQWAVKTGRWVDKRNGANPNFIPKAGDAVMYSTDNATFDHIGMVYELKDGKLTSIDGNYKNSVSYNLAYTKYVAGYVQL